MSIHPHIAMKFKEILPLKFEMDEEHVCSYFFNDFPLSYGERLPIGAKFCRENLLKDGIFTLTEEHVYKSCASQAYGSVLWSLTELKKSANDQGVVNLSSYNQVMDRIHPIKVEGTHAFCKDLHSQRITPFQTTDFYSFIKVEIDNNGNYILLNSKPIRDMLNNLFVSNLNFTYTLDSTFSSPFRPSHFSAIKKLYDGRVALKSAWKKGEKALPLINANDEFLQLYYNSIEGLINVAALTFTQVINIKDIFKEHALDEEGFLLEGVFSRRGCDCKERVIHVSEKEKDKEVQICSNCKHKIDILIMNRARENNKVKDLSEFIHKSNYFIP